MSGFRLVAYLYRCTVCGIEYQVQANERTVLACNHPSALDVLDNIDARRITRAAASTSHGIPTTP